MGMVMLRRSVIFKSLTAAVIGLSSAVAPNLAQSTPVISAVLAAPISGSSLDRAPAASGTRAADNVRSSQAVGGKSEFRKTENNTEFASATSEPGIIEKCACDKVLDYRGLDGTGKGKPLTVAPGKQVVLLIHGVDQGSNSWNKKSDQDFSLIPKDARPTLVEKLQQDPNFSIGTFDYNDGLNTTHIDFKSNNSGRYGPSLADTIKCLAQKSGMKVSLVGYSRGGLIAQEALNPLGPSKDSAANYVAGLVSIDTPWQHGLAPMRRYRAIYQLCRSRQRSP
jgi:hypothetical protein